MTKFDYEILMLLNEKNVDNPLKAVNISQILEDISVAKRKSYSTVYRHLQNMTKQGYVRCGFVDGLASTYYIDESGISYCAEQTKC
jgi:DNA-binding PadR family transcriptional regulator